MRTAVVRNGVVENVIEGIVDPAVHPGALLIDVTGLFVGPGFAYNGTSFIPPTVVIFRHILRHAFFKRFSDDELEDMEFLSMDDAAATVAIRRAKARLRRMIRVLESMEPIDLNDTRVRAWVQLMEDRGLLAVGRAAAILDAVIDADERP
jgi:hypothetical protein